MSKARKTHPTYETESFVIWEGEVSEYGFKSIGVKMNPPEFLNRQFTGKDLELVLEKFNDPKPQEGKELEDDTKILYMSMPTDKSKFGGAKGSDQNVGLHECYIKYQIQVKDGKGKHAGRRFANFVVKEIEVLQKDEEPEAA